LVFERDVMSDVTTLKISEVMTRMPRCIESHQSLELAGKWMNELNVRHLPVREAGKVVGILSDRDLGLMLVRIHLASRSLNARSRMP